MNAVEYGLICDHDVERKLVRNVNAFLKSKDYRKMYKWPNDGIRNIDDPGNDPKLAHIHVQFLKTPPKWYFDLNPNVDLRGIARFPDHLDCGWTLYFSKTHHELNSEEENAQLDQFVKELLIGSGYEHVLLFTYGKDDYRR